MRNFFKSPLHKAFISWLSLHMVKKHNDEDDDLKRISIKLDDEEHKRFKQLSDEESRSMTNLATLIVRKYIREAMAKRTPPES